MTMEDTPLRLVLFGLPSSGKSALLAALAHAGIIDSSPGLTELGKNLIENKLPPTTSEVVDYPIELEPAPRARPLAVNLVDSSGGAAAEMLACQRPVDGRGSGRLGKAMRSADALVVAADASADNLQLQRDFRQLADFLRLLEQGRGRRSDVAGLPVYLVLTKCDLLARKGDSAAGWMQRVQERKKQVDHAFQRFLAEQPERNKLAFGKINLKVYATAARQPNVADLPADADMQQPYGVADLFRQCVGAAATFQEREDRAAGRLQMTLAGVTGLIALMLLAAAGVYVTRPGAEVVRLENSLQGVLPVPGAGPAERLKEPFDKKLERLRAIQKDPSFSELPAATRDRVAAYVEELEAYRTYNKEFLDRVQDPRLATNTKDLDRIRKQLAVVTPPAEYADDWKDTRVGRRPEQWRKDIAILEREVSAVEGWINTKIQEGSKLEKEGLRLLDASADKKTPWLARYQKYLDERWPRPPAARPKGAANVRYETVYRFERIEQARRRWDEFKRERLRWVRQRLEEK